jgi:hypothetical protein
MLHQVLFMIMMMQGKGVVTAETLANAVIS